MYKQILLVKQAEAFHRGFAEPVARLVEPGHVKRAQAEFDSPLHEDLREYIRLLRPQKNSTYVVVNAMGAGEYYGDNINGDFFPYDQLVHTSDRMRNLPIMDLSARRDEATKLGWGYTTFYNAHPFKHHCFPADTLVTLANGDRKPIQDVKVGDTVRTSSGSRGVTSLFKRAYSGQGQTIRVSGLLSTIRSTNDHPFLVFRRDAVHCAHKYVRVDGACGCSYAKCQEWAAHKPTPEWVRAEEIKEGDYLAVPSVPHGSLNDPSFLYLAGLVASEGYLSASGSISFTYGKRNQEDISSTLAALAAHTTNKVSQGETSHGCVYITVCDRKLSDRLQTVVSGVLGEKKLHLDVLLQYDHESLLSFMAGYIDGDGHIPTSGRNIGQLRIRSSSAHMLLGLSDVLRSVGVPCSLNWDVKPHWMRSPTNHKQYATDGSGCVTVGKTYTPNVAMYSRKYFDRTPVRKANRLVVDGWYLHAVLSNTEELLNEEVFNLEVEGVHEYTAGEVVVHNCNKDPEKAYGTIDCSVWNEKMKRVELVVRLDHALCEKNNGGDILERAHKNDFQDVSMGCVFDPASRITLEDGTQKPIHEITKGDRVRTHTGRSSEVTEVFSQKHRGDVYSVYVSGIRDRLPLTPEHPLLVLSKSGNTAEWKRADTLSTEDFLLSPVCEGDAKFTLPVGRGDFFVEVEGRQYVARTILRIEKNRFDGVVYNFSVLHDESYLIENVASHNCKIPYDICSICGNKAATPLQYCEHIRDRRLKRDPRGDGQRPYMINIKPRFFDLSFVFIGADKTARTLMKIASSKEQRIYDYIREDVQYAHPHLGAAHVEKIAQSLFDSGYSPYAQAPPTRYYTKTASNPIAHALEHGVVHLTHHFHEHPEDLEEWRESAKRRYATLKNRLLSEKQGGMKLSDMVKYRVPHPDATEVSKLEKEQKLLPPSLLDMASDKMGLQGACECAARDGIILRKPEFARMSMRSAGLSHLLPLLSMLSLPPSDEVSCPLSMRLGRMGHGPSLFSPFASVRSMKPDMVVMRITMIRPAHDHDHSHHHHHDEDEGEWTDSHSHDSLHGVRFHGNGLSDRAKHELGEKLSSAYNGYRVWLMANAHDLGMFDPLMAPSVEQGFWMGRGKQANTGIESLTELALEHSFWR